MSTPEDETVTLHGIAADGAKLEIDMPVWAVEAIHRGQAVVWNRGGDLVRLEDDEGNVTRRYTRGNS